MDTGKVIELIVVVVTVVLGYSTWRREARGRKDMELAEEVLCLVYRAEWAIEAMRFPAWDMREGQTREAQPDETPEQKEARDRANVVFKRIRDNSDTFTQLNTLRFRFMARFGRDKAEPFDELRGIVNEVWVAAEELAQLWEKQLRARTVSNRIEDEIKELTRIIWSHGKNDQIVSRLRATVANVEKMCKPIIEGQSSWFSGLRRKPPTERGRVES